MRLVWIGTPGGASVDRSGVGAGMLRFMSTQCGQPTPTGPCRRPVRCPGDSCGVDHATLSSGATPTLAKVWVPTDTIAKRDPFDSQTKTEDIQVAVPVEALTAREKLAVKTLQWVGNRAARRDPPPPGTTEWNLPLESLTSGERRLLKVANRAFNRRRQQPEFQQALEREQAMDKFEKFLDDQGY